MKKIIALILAFVISIFALTSCSVMDIVWLLLDTEIGSEILDEIENEIKDAIEEEINNSLGDGSQNGDSSNNDTKYTYTSFTTSEKALFEEYFGAVIPFIPNDEYYVEEYELDCGDEYEVGLNFYTYGNTISEFEAYKAEFSKYSFDGTDTDEYGDKWYFYSTDDYYIDLTIYVEDGESVVDVYVYYYVDTSTGGDNGNVEVAPDVDGLITNKGAGLPTGTNGVHKVDFTKADKVKDVTDQGYYLEGCPTTGKVPVLVIPVEFSDVTAKSKGYTIDNIKRAFYGNDTDYYSVDEYYYISSYGKLDLEFTVADQWFKPAKASTYYANLTESYYGENYFIGDQVILDEALKSFR